MVKAVLLNGAGKYYTILCHVATLVSNLVTAAMDSNNDNHYSGCGFLFLKL